MTLFDKIVDFLAFIAMTVIIALSLKRGHKDKKSTADNNCAIDKLENDEAMQISDQERSDILKTIKVQVSHSCEKCRFNIPKNEARYCLVWLKPLCLNEQGECIPLNECAEEDSVNEG